MTLFKRFILWPLLLVSHLLAASLLAWHLLAQVNFAYPIGYKLLSIEQHIQEYGPQNRYKFDFEQTTPAEHRQIFGEIVKAVQNHGKGLADIDYRLADASRTPLMREAEVIHLQDVANLIDIFYQAGIIGLIIWLILFAYATQQRCTFPSLKKILIGFVALSAAIAITVLAIGPTRFFYWLHVKIFPDDHEWFFFYQDSLMTTLMHAPQLFGIISIIFLAVFALVWGSSIWAMARLLAQPIAQNGNMKNNGPRGSIRQPGKKKQKAKNNSNKAR